MEVFPYRGYEMRSYSETKWAAMMDALGIRWLYEPEIVTTRHGGYQPDFYLPDCDVYLEVKGPKPTTIEIEKAQDLERQSGAVVVFGHGRGADDAGNLAGYYLEHYSKDRKVMYTMYEISRGVIAWAGTGFFSRFYRAGVFGDAPSCVQAGAVVMNFIRSLIPRADIEKERRLNHQPLNQITLTADTVISFPTRVLIDFSRIAKEARAK
jgi:hypothetical protein